MAELRWVVDTAPLVAYLGGLTRGLGAGARRALDQVRAGRARVAVPTLCLFEVAQLEERGRISLGLPFEHWCDLVERAEGVVLQSLTRECVAEARALPALRDPFDRLIAGTAVALGVPLVTPDARIAQAGRVQIVW